MPVDRKQSYLAKAAGTKKAMPAISGERSSAASRGAGSTKETFLSDLNLSARYGVHRTTPWRWVKTDPTFPKPINLSPGCTRWKLSEIEAWEKQRAKLS